MPVYQTGSDPVPTVFDQVMTAWRAYWKSNPRPPARRRPFPFLIFQPTFASLYEHVCKPWKWLRNYRRPARRTGLYAYGSYGCDRRPVKCVECDIVIYEPFNHPSLRFECNNQTYRHYEQTWIQTPKMNTKKDNVSHTQAVRKNHFLFAQSSMQSDADQCNNQSSTRLGRPPVAPKTRSAAPVSPNTKAAMRSKRSSRIWHRELNCKKSVVLIPTATGAHSIPSPLPDIQTKFLVNISLRECVVIAELDSTAVLTSVLASCDIKDELIRLSYERVVVVDQIDALTPMVMNRQTSSGWDLNEQNQEEEEEEDYDYEITTRVEHSFSFPSNLYHLQAARVKQCESVVYIHVPRINC